MSATRRSRRGWRGVLAAVVLAAVVAACGSSTEANPPPAEGEPQSGGAINFGIVTESTGWLPAGGVWAASGYQVARAVFDPLSAYDVDGQVHPYLAESITSNEDFTEWTIVVRPGVQFHDGTPLDAEAVRLNLEAMKASAIWGQFLYFIDTMDVVDDLTLRLHMTEPFSTLPHLLSIQPGYMAAPSQLADPDGASNPVGTGPFVFEEWTIGESLEVTKNDNYWREGYPLVDRITFQVMVDAATRFNALQGGDLDVIQVRDAGAIVDIESSGDFDLYLDVEGEVTEKVIYLNANAEPFDDPDARNAVAFAIDKDKLSEAAYENRFPPANGPFREDSPWNSDVEFPAHDVERARDFAAAYEQAHGAPVSFTMQILPDPNSLTLAQLLQTMMDEAGIDMEIETIEGTTLLVNAAAGNYQALPTELFWGSNHPDRESVIVESTEVATLPVNFTGTSDPEIDAGIAASRATDDRQLQAEAWARIQEGLARQNTMLFLVHNDIGVAARPPVQDVDEWTLPTGEAGLPQEQDIIWLYQLWLSS